MSEEMQQEELPVQVPAICTLCVNCVFAQWDGDEQNGCDLNRLEAFAQNGADLVVQEDGSRTYYAIVGRFCNACRDHAWGDQRPGQDWEKAVAEEFRVRVHFIIYADGDSTLEAVGDSLDSVLDQRDPRAEGVTIMLNDPPDAVREYLRMIRMRDVRIPWEVRHTVADDAGSGPVYPTYERAVDQAISCVKDATTFYAIARAGYVWDAVYLAVIEDAINRRMIRCVALLPDNHGDGLLMDVRLHKHLLRGNARQGVIGKLIDVATEEGTEHMIKTWEDLRS